jgi:hypothetical protein
MVTPGAAESDDAIVWGSGCQAQVRRQFEPFVARYDGMNLVQSKDIGTTVSQGQFGPVQWFDQ